MSAGYGSDAAAGGATSGGSGGVIGGSGGAPSGGSGGTAGLGGLGGSGGVIPCSALVSIPPVLAVEPDPQQKYDDLLRLTESSDDGSQVSGVFVRQLSEPVNTVHHVTFSPWLAWPASDTLGPVYTTTIQTTSNHMVGRAPGSLIALGASDSAFVPFLKLLQPNAPGVGPGSFVPLDGAGIGFVVPSALGLGAHLVGASDGSNVWANVVDGTNVTKLPLLGCASIQGPRAGAVSFGDGWLVAASTGAPPGSCDDLGAPAPGLPTRIDVFRISIGGPVELVGSIDAAAQIVDVQATPHSQGVYVVWSQSSSGGLSGIRAARVSASFGVVVGPTSVLMPDEISLSFQAATMGDRLAVAHHNATFSPALILSVHDETLAPIAKGFFDSSDKPFSGPSSALASRDGRSLLVTFTNNTFPDPWRVRIARFDCVP